MNKFFITITIVGLLAAACEKKKDDSSTDDTIVAGDVAKVNLSTTAGAYALTCIPLTATGVDSSGKTVLANSAATFDLAATSGGGSFYDTAYCNMSTITQATIDQGASTKTVYYKNSSTGAIVLTASYNGTAGGTLSGTLAAPPISSVVLTKSSAAAGTQCVTVSVGLLDANNTYMARSSTGATTITITKTTATGTITFYGSAGCTGTNYTSGATTTVSIPANGTNTTLYMQTGTTGLTYDFVVVWSEGGDTGGGTQSIQMP